MPPACFWSLTQGLGIAAAANVDVDTLRGLNFGVIDSFIRTELTVCPIFMVVNFLLALPRFGGMAVAKELQEGFRDKGLGGIC